MSHRFTGHDPARGHDTGGVPWAGRTLTGTGFDGDTGEVDPRLAEVLARSAEDRDETELVAAVAQARVLVPIVAVPAQVDEVDGMPVDAVSDMAAVTLVAPDGQRALPVFSSTQALAAWDARARPVPTTARQAAVAALDEGCPVMVLDLPGSPGPAGATLRTSMVCALALGRTWVPGHRDPELRTRVEAVVADQPGATGVDLGPGPDGAVTLTLTLAPGLDRESVSHLVAEIGQRLQSDPETRSRLDGLAVRFR